MNLPTKPRPAETPEKPGSTLLALFLAGGLGLTILTALVFLTLGYIGPVIAVVAGVFLLIGFHYVVWGWWLGGVIRAGVEEEETRHRQREFSATDEPPEEVPGRSPSHQVTAYEDATTGTPWIHWGIEEGSRRGESLRAQADDEE